jgi:uncharacterized membrane protein
MPREKPEVFGEEESGRSLGRLIAFSDGVFAIAMTLLVLSLTVPNLTGSAESVNRELWEALKTQWPEVLGYAISFAVIGRYWLIHHRLFRLVRRADSALLVWNLTLLAVIALVPFPTELLGRYGDTTTAVVCYSLTMVLLGLCNFGLTRHVYRAELIDERVSDEFRDHSRWRGLMVPVAFAISIPIAFVDPVWATWSWAIVIAGLGFAIRHRYGTAIRHPYGRA